MKSYQYKIQWLLEPKDAYKIIKILGARSFTKIIIRNVDLDIEDIYTGFISYPTGLAEIETIKYLKRQFKKSEKKESLYKYIELYRTN